MSETPTQRVERIKKEKDGLDVIEDIKRLAKSGDAVEPDNIDRFKYYGLYTQRDSDSKEFMLRVKLINGQLNLEQLKVVANISREFAKDMAHFTTRQDVQFHNIKVKDLPEIFDRLASVGLTTQMAAGDCPRNTVSCPVSSLNQNEIIDTDSILKEVSDYFQGNREFSNLPRKFKIAITGCDCDCCNPEIQDITFKAFKSGDETLFSLSVGGGLSKGKQIALNLDKGCKAEQILPIAKAVAEIFRDLGSRENRKRARLRHLVADYGKDKFLQELNKRIDFDLIDITTPSFTENNKRGHYGINPSKKEGFDYIGFAVNSGAIYADGLFNITNILESNGASTIRVTVSQNFIVLDSPKENSQKIVDEFAKLNIFAKPSRFLENVKSCTGIAFCKFAVSETKQMAKDCVSYLEKAFPNFNEAVSISFTGCPNSCAHPQIVDFGFIGAMTKDEKGEKQRGFTLHLGGYLKGSESYFAKDTKIKVTPTEAPKLIEKILNEYIEKKDNFSNLQEFLKQKEF